MDQEMLAESRTLILQIEKSFTIIVSNFPEITNDQDFLNDLFRGIHNLKGVTGLVGLTHINKLSTKLQYFFDLLRKGRPVLNDQSIQVITDIIIKIKNSLITDRTELLGIIDDYEETEIRLSGIIPEDSEDENITEIINNFFKSVRIGRQPGLSDYEECRLVEHLNKNTGIYLIKSDFTMADFNNRLPEFQDKVKEQGELISIIPSEADDPENMRFEFILASD